MKRTKPALLPRRDFRKILGRAVRVSVALVVVLAVFGVIAGRRVYAQANDAAMRFGDQLLRINESTLAGDLPGDYYELQVNGQDIRISSGVSKKSMNYVLDYFELQCKNHADGLTQQFASMQHTLEQDPMPASEGVAGLGTLHSEKGRRGFVVCFATGHVLDDGEKVQMITEASRTGDLGRLGNMRYVVAEEIEGGGSHIVSAWTSGPLELKRMFPQEGDVPGMDIPGAPRPDDSRRVLSATAKGAPFGLIAYDAKGEHEKVVENVEGALVKAGWQTQALPNELKGVGRGYSLGGLDLFVSATSTQDDRTNISYVYSRLIPRSAGVAQ